MGCSLRANNSFTSSDCKFLFYLEVFCLESHCFICVCVCVCVCVYPLEMITAATAAAKSLSRVRLLATPWTAAHRAPLSMGFSRQEYWSGMPLPSPFEFASSPLFLITPSAVQSVQFSCSVASDSL